MSSGNPIQLASALHITEQWVKEWQKLQTEDVGIEYFVCGSIRRKEKMVRDIDVLIIDPDMHGKFLKGTKFKGVELNLCFVQKVCEGAGMLFLTGDYKFNIQLRSKAKRMGMKLNRYGLFRGDEVIASRTEHDIFKALGLAYVPPEQRSSPHGQKGVEVHSDSSLTTRYEVFFSDLHGFDFCECRGFQYRGKCKHMAIAAEQVS